MKKLILSLLFSSLSAFVFGQSILLTPQTIDAKQSSGLDNIRLRSADKTTNIVGVLHGGTLAAPSATLGGYSLLALEGAGYGTSFTGSKVGIYLNSSENWTNTANGTTIDFRTTATGSVSTLSRMKIDDKGNVGIGISAPDTRLHVVNSSAGAVTAYSNTIASFENSTSGYLSVLTPATSSGGILFGSPTSPTRGYLLYAHSTDKMTFGTTGSVGMTLDGAGNLGIGTSTPTAKLHVDGDFALKKKVLLTGNGGHSNYDRAGASVISIATPANGGGGETLGGIADGVDGLIIHVYPVQGTSLTLSHESTSSLAANRIILHTGSTVTFTNNGGATLMYDSSVSRWRVIGIAN